MLGYRLSGRRSILRAPMTDTRIVTHVHRPLHERRQRTGQPSGPVLDAASHSCQGSVGTPRTNACLLPSIHDAASETGLHPAICRARQRKPAPLAGPAVVTAKSSRRPVLGKTAAEVLNAPVLGRSGAVQPSTSREAARIIAAPPANDDRRPAIATTSSATAAARCRWSARHT
jgi:hypothetical protein